MANVNVKVLNSNIKTQSDFDGNFKIDIDLLKNFDKIIIEFSYVGMETKVVTVDDLKKKIKTILVPMDYALTGEVAVIKKPSLFKRFLNLFKRKK